MDPADPAGPAGPADPADPADAVDPVECEEYDELALLGENAEEVGLTLATPPIVERVSVEVSGGRRVSALRWGEGPPELVLLHGGAQNAHTWDTVALALDRPLLALDLPGHGHSDWKPDHDYWPPSVADDVATAIAASAPAADAVVGMSWGGLVAVCVAARHPALVRRLGLVDVTPGVDHAKAEPIVEFISGPQSFASFDEILERTIAFNPTRSVSSLRRGVLHNARPVEDGTWTWRWDPGRSWREEGGPDFASLWDELEAVDAPVVLYRGRRDSSVVGDDDVAELARRRPDARVVDVVDAGHSIQGDQPLELARLLDELVGECGD